MARSDNLYALPADLPVPADDGTCDHLTGMRLPSVPLPSTRGAVADLSQVPGRAVVYIYPRTGHPDKDLPRGWNDIPGARGCTPQSCAFRDFYAELESLGARVYGLSTQTTEYQQEMAERLHLPFEVLSDARLEFARALELPTFEVEDMVLIKRITLIIANGIIENVFYPVFPPDRNAGEVVDWLQSHPA